MNAEEKRKELWLCRYQYALLERQRRNENLTEFRMSYGLAKSQTITDMPTGSREDAGIEKYMPKLEELEQAFIEQDRECRRIRAEIVAAIESITGIDAETYRLLIQLRYISCKYWWEVAEDMHYSSIPYVKGKLRRKAIEALKI